MRRTGTALCGLLLVVACGGSAGRSQADQDRDGRALAAAIAAADGGGAGFNLDQRLVVTGGSIPSGSAFDLHTVVSGGELREGAARFAYQVSQGSARQAYDVVFAGERLYVKRHGATAWKSTPLPAATALFPVLRLELLRETVLLAASVSSGAFGHVDAGFARKYVVQPAADQLEQLESVSVQGQAEQQFLRSATGELDLYLVVPGDRLVRVELHLTGVDPGSGERQQVNGTLDLRSARVGAIQAPGSAQAVDPNSILS